MNRLEKAVEFRKRINANLQATRKLIRVDELDELDENELLDMIDLYESYQADKLYKVDDIFNYEGKLYKVIQEHISLENWVPSELPALYLSMMPENVIPEWVQPTGVHDAYELGDKVIFENKVWVCTQVDAGGKNSWAPGEYGWETEGG